MKVELWVVGKTNFTYLSEGIALYEKRLKHYLQFELVVLPDVKVSKKESTIQVKTKEGKALLDKCQESDYLVLLDDKGSQFTSEAFATQLERYLQMSVKRIIFVIGGAYGFSEALYQRANAQLSLSKMTFSHQMVRLIFVEQLYRAMTILKNEPYHHI
ncbi:MAG: 23S rRNA (pseudouridine(1915)-N(3))-methyltransferase RlmH [Saprospiraceae bacterium]|nr:23S rRNA (pseudouridine(1915)-N(3))-methyltransferase RlmH [Saprospiraceae bacterium]